MKNVYLYIVFLLMSFNSFGQDLQNSNWLFGHKAWLNFSMSSPTPINGSAMDIWEGCASISDQYGNLMFYTNGMTVWNKNHIPMTNGNNTLISSASNSQGVIIVPKPDNPNKYYIVYIDGFTGNRKGLRYCEVDMTNGLGEVVLATRNTVLKDHNGIDIDASYNSESEKLTSTVHANGVDYWVITQIKNYVYSYKVTSTGIGDSKMPNSYTYTSVSLTNGAAGYASSGSGCMKISPDNKRIAIAYERKISVSNPNGGVLLGSFNSNSGLVTVNTLLMPYLKNPYGIEFSPNSQYIYFSTAVNISQTTTPELFKISGTTYQLITSLSSPGGTLQRAINNKIYFSEFNGGNLSVINSPDNYNSPDFQENSINLGGKSMYGGLPQWNYLQNACPSDLILTSTTNDVIAPAQDLRQAQNTITASNIVNNGAVGIYHAGDDVLLKSGFYSASGSVFRGYIEDCSDQFVGLSVTSEDKSMWMADSEAISEELFTLYPNPAKDRATVISDRVMTNITVTGLDGYALFKSVIKGNSYDLNIADYPKGFYIITVTTESGETEMKKLIKN